MKRLLAFALCLFLAASAVAQDSNKLTGIAAGLAMDVLNNDVTKGISQARFEVSPVIQIRQSPRMYFLPGLRYSTLGLAGVELGVYTLVKQIGNVGIYLGGSFTPEQFLTADNLDRNHSAAAAVNLSGVWKVWERFYYDPETRTDKIDALKLAFDLKYEATNTSTEQQVTVTDKLWTLKVGLIF